MFIARAVVVTASGPRITYSSGPSASKTDAISELKAKLLLVVGVNILSSSVTESLDTATEGFSLHASGIYEEATLVLQKAGAIAGQIDTANVKIENMSLAYKMPTAGVSLVDTTAADIADFVAAFKNGSGVGGYTATPGLSKYRK